jgi:methylthioribose-1-phosphate isomerase
LKSGSITTLPGTLNDVSIRPLFWDEAGLHLIDQRVLPVREDWIVLDSAARTAEAIRDMVVRGAPAIGVTAAYGMALAAKHGEDRAEADAILRASRPTAVNLFWALDRIAGLASFDPDVVLQEAIAIEQEDLEMNHAMGEFGATLLPDEAIVLTICNTGSLATAGHGTALGIIRTGFAQGKVKHVYSCETRPRQQGLRLTAWELMKDQIPFQSIPDGSAASLLSQGKVNFIVAGADRIAANGDTANKIGTYMLAILAKHFGVPFVIAAPSSTFDPTIPDGTHIPIEERDASEITHIEGQQVAPTGCPVWNPGFDVTPNDLISAIVTEKGIFRPPYRF